MPIKPLRFSDPNGCNTGYTPIAITTIYMRYACKVYIVIQFILYGVYTIEVQFPLYYYDVQIII